MFYIGAHISRKKTLIDTIDNIIENKGNALQIFASNPRSVNITNINNSFFGNLNEIENYVNKNKFAIVIHSPYTINIAKPFINGKKIMDLDDCYWIKLIIHELKIAHEINSYGCIIHTGKYTTNTKEEGLKNMKIAIKYVINEIIRLKLNSKIILETASGQGTELLNNYQDFLDFYNSFTKKEKNYFKLCIDTCHIWASGYELQEIFNLTIKNGNINDIAIIHVNNSKNPKNSHLDRHEEMINKDGYIDINDILNFIKNMKDKSKDLIIILETPSANFKYEIELLL